MYFMRYFIVEIAVCIFSYISAYFFPKDFYMHKVQPPTVSVHDLQGLEIDKTSPQHVQLLFACVNTSRRDTIKCTRYILANADLTSLQDKVGSSQRPRTREMPFVSGWLPPYRVLRNGEHEGEGANFSFNLSNEFIEEKV